MFRKLVGIVFLSIQFSQNFRTTRSAAVSTSAPEVLHCCLDQDDLGFLCLIDLLYFQAVHQLTWLLEKWTDTPYLLILIFFEGSQVDFCSTLVRYGTECLTFCGILATKTIVLPWRNHQKKLENCFGERRSRWKCFGSSMAICHQIILSNFTRQ